MTARTTIRGCEHGALECGSCADLRRRVAEQYPDDLGKKSPARGVVRGRTALQDRAAASKRAKTGAKFEAELNDTHEGFTRDTFGHIIPHYPPTVQLQNRDEDRGPPKLVYKKGGGPCDYSGHVNMLRADHAVDWRLAKASEALDVAARYGELSRFVRVPVVFDAKTLGVTHHSYRHKPERIAQIFHLKNAHISGALAFLLVRADEVGRVFAIGYDNHTDELMRGRPITLFEKKGAECFPLLPSVTYTPGKGWLWPKLLPWLLP